MVTTPPPVPLPGPIPGLPGQPVPSDPTGSTQTIRVAGDIDITTGPALAYWVRAAVRAGAEAVRLDLSGATFVDSAGLVAILEARAAAAAADARLLLRPSPSVRDLLWLTGLLGSFELD